MMKKFFLSAAGFLGTRVGLSFEDQEVVAYGLEVTFSLCISLMSALLVGLYWGIVPEILVVALVWMSIRSLAGGAHCSTLWRCAFFSTLVVISLGGATRFFAAFFDQKLTAATILFCGAAALTITFAWAPADNAKNRILSASRRRKFRHKALAAEISLVVFLLLTCFLTGNKYSSLLLAAGLAMLMEALTVSPAGYRAMASVDKSLAFLERAVWRGGEKG